MAFGNVLIPDTTTADLKGLFLLLDLVAHPERAQAAQQLLTALSQANDDAQTKLDAAIVAQREADNKAAANERLRSELDEHKRQTLVVQQQAKAAKEQYETRMATMKEWLAKGG